MGLGKFGKLFFDEVEEENQTGSVSEKNTQSAAPTVSTQSTTAQQPTVQQLNVSTTSEIKSVDAEAIVSNFDTDLGAVVGLSSVIDPEEENS